ncbi:MAG: hypothetical protein ACPGYX_12605, partial [Oceanobacter sp.]
AGEEPGIQAEQRAALIEYVRSMEDYFLSVPLAEESRMLLAKYLEETVQPGIAPDRRRSVIRKLISALAMMPEYWVE